MSFFEALDAKEQAGPGQARGPARPAQRGGAAAGAGAGGSGRAEQADFDTADWSAVEKLLLGEGGAGVGWQ
jgi:hypothetical protein